MLVVVEDGDVELLHEPFLDLEAAGCRDVLEVDAAEARRHQLHRADDLLGVGRVQAEREGVHAGELLEQAALALHHGHRGPRADVAEAEHRGSVGDHRDGVALDRVLEGLVFVVGDRQADAGDAGRVDHREVVAGLQGMLVGLFDLAADVEQECAIGNVDHLGPFDGVDRRDDLVPVLPPGGVDDDVTKALTGVGLDDVNGHHDAAGLADRARRAAEDALVVVELHADRQAVLRAWGCAHFSGSSVVGGRGS